MNAHDSLLAIFITTHLLVAKPHAEAEQ